MFTKPWTMMVEPWTFDSRTMIIYYGTMNIIYEIMIIVYNTFNKVDRIMTLYKHIYFYFKVLSIHHLNNRMWLDKIYINVTKNTLYASSCVSHFTLPYLHTKVLISARKYIFQIFYMRNYVTYLRKWLCKDSEIKINLWYGHEYNLKKERKEYHNKFPYHHKAYMHRNNFKQ